MARSFNGTTDGLSFSAHASSSGPFSISLWVNFDPATTFTIFVDDPGSGYMLVGSGGGGVFPAHIDLGGTAATISSSNIINAGVWYHIGATGFFDVAGSTSGSIYINGVLNTSGTIGHFVGGTSTWTLATLSTTFVKCTMADAAFWNAGLTAFEFAALANGARPYTIRPTSLFNYFPLGGNQSPEPDLSGNASNATFIGSPTPAFGPPFMQFTPRWPQFISAPPPVIPTRIAPPGFAWAEW
jgi:hypothetical protein